MNEPGPRDGGGLQAEDSPRGGGVLPGDGGDSRPGGFLLLDKPRGISSFQALNPLKRIFRGLKIGHAGTLDPAASGLLLVGVGGGTRLLEYLEGMPKTYTFLARFGLASDTFDMDGTVSGSPAAALERDEVEAALAAFRGPILQTPPAYSAIKVNGERAYDLARAGQVVAIPARKVEVHALELLSFEDGVGRFRMTCSKGTYVRSLVHDLGAALGCGAVADAIRRTAIGPFRVETAVTPESVAQAADAAKSSTAIPATSSNTPVATGTQASRGASTPPSRGVPTTLPLLPLESAVAHLPAAILAPHRLVALRDGRSTAPGSYTLQSPDGQALDWTALWPSVASESPEVRVLDTEGRFLAIATLTSEGNLCPKKVLARI